VDVDVIFVDFFILDESVFLECFYLPSSEQIEDIFWFEPAAVQFLQLLVIYLLFLVPTDDSM
jgi:hypothetical protein